MGLWSLLFGDRRGAVKVKSVTAAGVIRYDVESVLASAPAKRHLASLRKHGLNPGSGPRAVL